MISVVIPAYNKADRIDKVIRKASLYADEVLDIDDNSSDQTAVIANKAGVKVLINRGKKGYAGSVKTGLGEAKGYIVVTLDGDGEHDPDEIPLLTRHILDGDADLVLGKREKIPRISERLIAL